MKKFFIVLAVLVVLWLIFRKPLLNAYNSRVAGLQAAQNASQENTYTTYNTALYDKPFWAPIVNFFKAGAYAPSGQQQPANQSSYAG